jgi:hypothetical protein
LNGFIWYLHSLWRIPCGNERFGDTFIVGESIWQFICKFLQMYDILNL